VRAQTRHSLKEDRFSKATISAAESAAHWTVEHKGKLIAGAAILVAVIAAVLGAWFYLQRQDERASLDLSKATRTLEAPLRPAGAPAQPEVTTFTSAKERATEARKEFQGVMDKYPHTRASEFARYFAGVTSVDLGDNATAERDLKDVASSHHKDLSSLAKFALASLYRKTNRDKEAIDFYKQLIDKPTDSVGKATAQLELADLYQQKQQPQEAKRIYEQVQKENPTNEVGNIAQTKLAALK